MCLHYRAVFQRLGFSGIRYVDFILLPLRYVGIFH